MRLCGKTRKKILFSEGKEMTQKKSSCKLSGDGEDDSKHTMFDTARTLCAAIAQKGFLRCAANTDVRPLIRHNLLDFTIRSCRGKSPFLQRKEMAREVVLPAFRRRRRRLQTHNVSYCEKTLCAAIAQRGFLRCAGSADVRPQSDTACWILL